MIPISVICGLVAMLCWGIADFLQTIPTRKMGSLKTMLIFNLIGLFPTIVIYLIFIKSAEISALNLGLLFLSAVIQTHSYLNLLKSFEIGEVSVVAPISATYSIITVALAIIFLNEKLSFLKSISLVTILIGIVLTSADLKKLKTLHAAKGVKQAIIAMLGWGVYFFLIGLVAETTDFISIFIFTGFTNGLFGVLYPLLGGTRLNRSDVMQKNLWPIFIINSILFGAAWLSVNYGLKGQVSIVTSLSSLYPAITVVLAMIFFKEKLANSQKVGIVTVLFGIFLISL